MASQIWRSGSRQSVLPSVDGSALPNELTLHVFVKLGLMYLQHVCINTGVVLKHFLRNGQVSRCFITAVGVTRPGHEPALTVTRPMISATIAVSCGVLRDYHSKNSRSPISQTEGLKVSQHTMTGHTLHLSLSQPHRVRERCVREPGGSSREASKW